MTQGPRFICVHSDSGRVALRRGVPVATDADRTQLCELRASYGERNQCADLVRADSFID